MYRYVSVSDLNRSHPAFKINIGCNVVQNGYFTYIFIYKNLINAAMPIFFLSTIFVFNFDLMKSVMSFTTEMICVGVLLS